MIKSFCRTCTYCQFNKNGKKYAQLEGNLHYEVPFEQICSDIYGPIDGSQYKHNFDSDTIYVVTITDRCSRFTTIEFVTDISSKKFKKHFKKDV